MAWRGRGCASQTPKHPTSPPSPSPSVQAPPHRTSGWATSHPRTHAHPPTLSPARSLRRPNRLYCCTVGELTSRVLRPIAATDPHTQHRPSLPSADQYDWSATGLTDIGLALEVVSFGGCPICGARLTGLLTLEAGEEADISISAVDRVTAVTVTVSTSILGIESLEATLIGSGLVADSVNGRAQPCSEARRFGCLYESGVAAFLACPENAATVGDDGNTSVPLDGRNINRTADEFSFDINATERGAAFSVIVDTRGAADTGVLTQCEVIQVPDTDRTRPWDPRCGSVVGNATPTAPAAPPSCSDVVANLRQSCQSYFLARERCDDTCVDALWAVGAGAGRSLDFVAGCLATRQTSFGYSADTSESYTAPLLAQALSVRQVSAFSPLFWLL